MGIQLIFAARCCPPFPRWVFLVGYWIRNRQNCIITVFDPLPGDGPHPGEVW